MAVNHLLSVSLLTMRASALILEMVEFPTYTIPLHRLESKEENAVIMHLPIMATRMSFR